MAHIRGGWEAEGGLRLPLIHRRQYRVAQTVTIHRIGQVGCSLASDTSLLIGFIAHTQVTI